jgi:hypothetical protein
VHRLRLCARHRCSASGKCGRASPAMRLLASVYSGRGRDEHEREHEHEPGIRTEEPASRTTPYRPTAHFSSAHCGMRVRVRVRVRTLSHGGWCPWCQCERGQGRGPAAMPSARGGHAAAVLCCAVQCCAVNKKCVALKVVCAAQPVDGKQRGAI